MSNDDAMTMKRNAATFLEGPSASAADAPPTAQEREKHRQGERDRERETQIERAGEREIDTYWERERQSHGPWLSLEVGVAIFQPKALFTVYPV